MPNYISTVLNEEISIHKIVTVHYFEYNSNFFYPGETHDFWEFLYVDKGEIEVTASDQNYTLKKGDIIFHEPMQFHKLWANGVIAPNLVVVAFECNSPAMDHLAGKRLKLAGNEHNCLAEIIKGAQDTYCSPLDDPLLLQLKEKEHPPFASSQMIKLHLELMLLSLIRRQLMQIESPKSVNIQLTLSIKEKKEEDLLHTVIHYLNQNLNNDICYEDVCKACYVGRSYLQKIFRKQVGGGVMEYYNKLKIEKAKQYIRESSKNFTEISESLGYTSIHYFSRYFKKSTGMTPTEYASSIKAQSEIIYSVESDLIEKAKKTTEE